ncbi:citrate synthase [Azospirillum sp. INR13]|uniref:citrate synthase n=1 Tax=Azospirillum sp. INR13 TaxID=2596919 RepID=UPI0019D62810|nr:citrate synthase [Azospirillum sp. INR13]
MERISAAETSLSGGDPATGEMVMRGHRLPDLIDRPYEEVVAILWETEILGSMSREALAAARCEAFTRLSPLFAALPSGLTVIERQRVLLASLPGAAMTPLLLVAGTAVAAASAVRLADGQAPIAPDLSQPHAADLLRMLRGAEVDGAEQRALNRYLVAMVDHGVNASTLTARVVASTGGGLTAAAVAALGALEGPLHGGAPGLVLDMLDAIGEAGSCEEWVGAALARGERLMGFGSRAYHIRDPRADVMKDALLALQRSGASRAPEGRLAFAEAVERTVLSVMAARRPDRTLNTNVEFYAALLLEALGIPRAGFTPLFAASRTAGWAAHVREQERTGRMLRPTSRYVGPPPNGRSETRKGQE